MRTLITVLIFLTCCCCSLFSQSIKPADLVLSSTNFTSVELFDHQEGQRNSKVPAEISDYSLLSLKTSTINQLFANQNDNLKFDLPYEGKQVNLLLVPVLLQSEQGYVVSEPSGEKIKVNPGIHYRGVVKGEQKSIVALSVYDGEVMGLITSPLLGNLVLGKISGDTDHMLYKDDQILDRLNFECGTEDTYEPYEQHELEHNHDGERALSDCVSLYFEVDNDIYQDKGGLTGTTNYVTGLYNQVATMYANENINTTLSPLVIWEQTSPYSSTSSSGMLNQFTGYRQGFDGDLAMLLSYQASGGIAYVDGLCGNNPDYSMSFSSINSTYSTVPTYSWSVMVVTHEFGHLFGSQHTHACVWNGNNTAIDGCYTTEGGCADPGIPSGGGTVMSYCHLTSAGINLNNGFGSQPGNLIRSRVTNANCLSACDGGGGPTCTDGVQNGSETGVDCGGPDCPACPTACTENEATLTIVLDNYPGETTWTITGSNGSVLFSGGPYSTAGSTVTQELCLLDGCFDFTINDSYGDGICCGYGQGSFAITNSGGTLTSGGQFGSTITNNFCVGGGSTPTCNDGIQNGNETGVDCGGTDCPACPTCTDGVQNGNETGVDCGGPDCPACTSCNDGIQNGNETGVDCGGTDCPACPTCTDGVQNGNETGVDCGGPDCPACTSCNDGIQNGNETGVDCGGTDCPACPTCTDGVQNGNETGIDCGGPDCPACPTGCTDNEATLTIVLDNYPSETTWSITDANGTVIYSGGPYSTVGGTVTQELCLADGCFDFTMNDSFGDGICCAYGQGSYVISGVSGTLASGGDFGSTVTNNFCFGGGPVPTCTDGLQNGNETGVDCGGPDCDPCDNGGGGDPEEIFAHYFESGWDGWQDGGSDCYRYSGFRSYEGNYSIRIRDNSGAGSTMTSSDYDLSSYSGVELGFYFYPSSMESGEDFYVQYFDGSNWQTVASYVSGSDFINNQFYETTIPILGSMYNMASDAKLRITCDASSNADRIYIDQVILTSTGGNNLISGSVETRQLASAFKDEVTKGKLATLTPNPTTDYSYLSIETEVPHTSIINITDVTGSTVYSTKRKLYRGNNEIKLETADYATGTYFISFTDEEGEATTLKFIKVD